MSSQDESASKDASGAIFNPKHAVGPQLAHNLEQTQINKFHCKGGTGFAAEDANTLSDVFQGRQVDQVGKSCTLNGADRLVDGVMIQSKYYASAASTIRESFDKNTGLYRYPGQRLEVPADQYDACLAKMRLKIAEGKVPGFTNPADAESIVQKGSVTYRQARNIAKAGTIDGLTYDAKSHAVGAGLACGVSFAIQYAQLIWSGASQEEALKEATLTGLGTGAISLSAGIIASQVLRSRAAAVGAVAFRRVVKTIHTTEIGKTVIRKIAQVSLGKAVYSGAAINHVAKLARSNVVTSVVITAVSATPDFYRAAFARNISWTQFSKNLAVNASGVAGGAGGWFAGAAGGAVLGSVVPAVGTVAGGIAGGILGSLAGGGLVSYGSKKALDYFVDDDAVSMMRLLEEHLPNFASECMLSEAEVQSLVEYVQQKVRAGFLRDLYMSNSREVLVVTTFKPFCFELTKKREHIHLPSTADVEEEVLHIVEDVVDTIEKFPAEGASV